MLYFLSAVCAAEVDDLATPRMRTVGLGVQCFSLVGPSASNSLSSELNDGCFIDYWTVYRAAEDGDVCMQQLLRITVAIITFV